MAKLLLVVPKLWPHSMAIKSPSSGRKNLKGLLLPKIARLGLRNRPNWNQLLEDISGIANAAQSAAIYWLGETTDSLPSWLCRADPLHLRTAGGGLIAIPPNDDELTLEEAQTLVQALNQCLASTTYQLVIKTATHWYMTGEEALDLPVVPNSESLRGRFIDNSPFREPRFTGAQQLRTELEMCLFDQAWNKQQEQADKAPINGVWFWGGVAGYQPATACRRFQIYADAPLIKGCARAGRQSIDTLPQKLDPRLITHCKTGADLLFYIDTVFQNVHDVKQWTQQAEVLDRNWLRPAWQALQSGLVSELLLIDPGRLMLQCSHQQSRRWWRRWWRIWSTNSLFSSQLTETSTC